MIALYTLAALYFAWIAIMLSAIWLYALFITIAAVIIACVVGLSMLAQQAALKITRPNGLVRR